MVGDGLGVQPGSGEKPAHPHPHPGPNSSFRLGTGTPGPARSRRGEPHTTPVASHLVPSDRRTEEPWQLQDRPLPTCPATGTGVVGRARACLAVSTQSLRTRPDLGKRSWQVKLVKVLETTPPGIQVGPKPRCPCVRGDEIGEQWPQAGTLAAPEAGGGLEGPRLQHRGRRPRGAT